MVRDGSSPSSSSSSSDHDDTEDEEEPRETRRPELLFSDMLFYKSGSRGWLLERVGLRRDRLELRSGAGKKVVLLTDGFIAHAVSRVRSEKLFEFNVAGQRGELRFAARSLEARDEWLDRLEALPTSRKARASTSTSHVFLDGRRTTRVDGVFASYLWKRTSWGQWRRRWFLLLAEKGQLRYYKKALTETDRASLAERGDLPEGSPSTEKGRIQLLESSLWTEHPDKIRGTRFAVKNTRQSENVWSWLLDARAEDLAETWMKKIEDAIDFAKRRQAQERDFRRALAVARFDDVADDSDDSDDEDPSDATPTTTQPIFVPTRRPIGSRGMPIGTRGIKTGAPTATIPVPSPEDKDDGPRISIHARSNGGRHLLCRLPPVAKLIDLKRKIHAQDPDFPPDRIRILYHGKPLDSDDASLADLDVLDNADLFFVLRR